MACKQRYAIIRGQVYRWDEKAPFVESGRSVHGALEVDIDSDLVRCHECGEWFSSLGLHVLRAHNINVADYKERHGMRRGVGMTPPARREKAKQAAKGITSPRFVNRTISEKARSARLKLSSGNFAEVVNERGNCRAQTVLSMQRIAVELGRTPTSTEVPANVKDAAVSRFGSWTKAIAAAGLEPNRRYATKDGLRESLIDFYVLNRRLPRTREWGQGRLSSMATYGKYFGSIRAAYAEAGLALVAQQRSGRALIGSNAAVLDGVGTVRGRTAEMRNHP